MLLLLWTALSSDHANLILSQLSSVNEQVAEREHDSGVFEVGEAVVFAQFSRCDVLFALLRSNR